MSDAPEKAKEIWAVVGYIGPQNMRGEWATDPAKIMGGVTSYTRTDLYTAALTRMTDLEAAARHNSDWARQAIADKEAVEKERDALQAEVARLTEWDAANRIEALVEEVDALRAEHAQIEAAMPEVVHAMADLCDDYIKDIPELAERWAAIRAVLPMPDTKGTRNAD